MVQSPCRLAVLLSGAGSTLVNLHQRIQEDRIPAEIVVAVSSRSTVLGVERARERAIPVEILTRGPFKKGAAFDETAYSAALAERLAPWRPDLVVMAGFMTRLAAPVLDRYDVVNVHPALLPMFGGEGFYGHYVHEAVLQAGVKITGATVHFADAHYDRGPIIAQEAVPVLEDDTPDTLAARVQEAERRLYPRAIALYAEGRLRREGGRVRVLSEKG